MKIKRMVKRLFAVGAGVTMLGATAMGAMAADLSTYPTMFVKDGTFNGFFVVGENAAAVDNLAMTDIAAAMKYNKPTATSTTTVEGDSWKVGTAAKKLEMANTNSTAVGEQIYDIEQFIGKDELAALASGTYSTSGTSSTFTQRLYFDRKNNAQNEIVKFVENDNDVTADFFYVLSGGNMGEYELEFSSAPESTIQNTAGSANTAGEVLDDFENTQISMLGKPFDIVLARRPQATPIESIKLTLMGGSVRGSLLEGDTTTLENKGQSYEVTLTFVDETYAKFVVNGEQTDKLQVGDTYKLSDKTEIGLAERLYQSYAGGVHSADFFIGASKLEMRDNNVSLLSSGSTVLKVGSETISGADVNIEGTDDSTTFTLSKIRINMTAQDDYYVPANGKLSDAVVEQGDDKELLFTNNWDIQYLGLAEEVTHDISLISSTDRKYKLRFWDGNGNQVDLPLAYANTSTRLQMTEDASDKEVILNEALNISKNDYFVVTAGTAASGTAKTFAFQYKGSDKNTATSPKIKFKELGSGDVLEYAVDTGTTSAVATIKIGGYSFTVKNITDSGKDTSDFTINVDLNGDGTMADDTVVSAEIDIVDYYGMQIDFGNQLYLPQEDDTTVDFRNTTHQPVAQPVKNIEMNWTTPNGNDYDDQPPPTIFLNASATSTNEVTIGLFQVDATSNPSLTPEGEENIGYGYTTMGAKWTYTTPSGSPNEFKYAYPENQRVPQLYVTSGAVTSSTSSGGDLVAVEVIDATKLDSEIASASAQNLVVVGGPCVNTVAAELLGNPADCTQGFSPGKARVKLFENANGNIAMLVAGYSGADTRLAGKVVAHRAKEFSGSEVEVSGTTYTDATIGAPAVVAVEATPVEEPAPATE